MRFFLCTGGGGAAAWSAARSLVAYFCSPKSENFWSMPTRSTAPAALPAATTPIERAGMKPEEVSR
mgnify:CR=1 FL=1